MASAKPVIEVDLPNGILRRKVHVVQGWYYGANPYSIYILLSGTSQSRAIYATVTTISQSVHKFEVELQARTGIYAFVVIVQIGSDGKNLISQTVGHVEFIPPRGYEVKQLCDVIDAKIAITTTLEPRGLQTLPHNPSFEEIYDDLLWTEQKCIEAVQKLTSAATVEDQQWKALLDLHNVLLPQYDHCYSVLKPDHRERFLDFLPFRMWEAVICPLIHSILCSQPLPSEMLEGILQSVQTAVQKLPQTTSRFCEDKNFMLDQLSFIYNLYVRSKPHSSPKRGPSLDKIQQQISHIRSCDEIPKSIDRINNTGWDDTKVAVDNEKRVDQTKWDDDKLEVDDHQTENGCDVRSILQDSRNKQKMREEKGIQEGWVGQSITGLANEDEEKFASCEKLTSAGTCTNCKTGQWLKDCLGA